MVVHGYFRQKWALCGHLSSTRASQNLPHKCWLAIDQILGFLVEALSGSKIRPGQPSVLLKRVDQAYVRHKWSLCGHSSSTRASQNLPHKCFLAIDHILGFLVETISWSKIRTC